MQIHELDLVIPHFAQEVLEHLDRQLLAWAAPIAEAERCEPGVVTDRQRLTVGNAKDGAEPAIGQAALRPSATLKVVISKGHRARPICLHLASSIWSLVGTSL
jgi:hypothetical protein